MEVSGREQFREERQHVALGGGIDFPHPLDQPLFVYGADLIQHDLAGFAFESDRDAGGIGTEFRRHGGDDDGVNVMVHFVRRDDEAGAGFSDFTALGGIETDEADVEAGRYDVHSLRSHADGAADS